MAELIWTENAVAELDAIADYIALDNPEAAKKLVQQITAKTRLLKQFPLLGRTLNVETNSEHRGYFVHPCVIVYRISLSGDIFVLHCYRQEQAISLADD